MSGYDCLGVDAKAKYVQNRFNKMNGTNIYATSRDWNLRELEIDFILKSLNTYTYAWSKKRVTTILDIGCGNGYTDLRIASEFKAIIIGQDFSEKMIQSAYKLKEKYKNRLKGIAQFCTSDMTQLTVDKKYDVVVSERGLLNLPTREIQFNVIKRIHKALKPNGIYIMVEGTQDGLRKLNDLREKVGLNPIEDKDQDNVMSLKFNEQPLEKYLEKLGFTIVTKQYFGMYYLISRVVHPLLVAPEEPQWNAKINEVAKQIALIEPNYKDIGHVVAYLLQKK